ncbi:phosphate ABC transporter substrate-binding protein PstS [uncultured Rhodoblastus sp.]|uniref:phosphate ABC transporter substrate-binding protein PstS n=1 Tax=uncultured Rhodoblastus sp. TaxID=543037 RepID=UPI0025FC2435|nr:phosphate ABC transporter substrate-binding protein PstS [uncultured Rhodoblastus sp.]
MLLPGKLTGPWAATLAGAFWLATAAVSAPALADGIELHGAGSTLAAPLYEKWIGEYQRTHNSVILHYAAVGSGEGVARFASGAVDFGASDVALASEKAAKIAGGVVQVPSTAGMVVLAYNLPGFKGELKLPQDVYSDIFLGRIHSWDDPRIAGANPGLKLPARTIAVVVRQDSSGTTYAFTSHLAAVSKNWGVEGRGAGTVVAWPHEAMNARGNEGVASRIKIADNSIGYVEYGFARRLGLKVAALQNSEGRFVLPSPEAGEAAMVSSATGSLDGLGASIVNPHGPEAYPIVTYSWLLLHRHYPPEQARVLKSFVLFALGDGQKQALNLGYIALPPAVTELAKAAVVEIDAEPAAPTPTTRN